MGAWRLAAAAVIALALAAPAHAQEDVGLLKALGKQTLASIPVWLASLPNGTVLFSANDGVHGRELWSTDGTAAGTRLFADIVEGPAGSNPGPMEVVDGVAYFAAAGSLWRSDGTLAGTREVAELQEGPSLTSRTSEPQRWTFQPLGDQVAFVLHRADGGPTLTITAPEGIRSLDVFPEGETTSLELHASTGSELFLTRNGLLYRTDGTRAGTRRVESDMGVGRIVTVDGYAVLIGQSFDRGHDVIGTVAPGATRTSYLADATGVLRELDGAAYFGNRSGLHRWTPSGITTLSAAEPVEVQSYYYGAFDIEKAGDSVFWVVRNADGYSRLHRSDGMRSGPVPGNAFAPTNITAVGPDRVLFYAHDDRAGQAGIALWVADAAGMRRLSEPVINGGPFPIAPARHGAVYRGAWDSELHRTDGTPAGTGLLVDINRRPTGSAPISAARVGGRVVFTTVEDGLLWVTDGTAAGTTPVRDLLLSPYGIASDGTTAYFTAIDGRLYQTDGSPAGTRAITGGFASNSFIGLGRVGSAYVFGARPPGYDLGANELWRTDGTAAGTRPFGVNIGAFAEAAAANDRTLLVTTPFSLVRTDGSSAAGVFEQASFDAATVPDGFLSGGATQEVGYELFHLDPDGADPRLVADLVPGVAPSSPRWLTRAGDRVLFVADIPGFPPLWRSADLGGQSIEPLTALEGFPFFRPETIDGQAYVTTAIDGDALLYRTDGTNAGTVLLHRFPYGSAAPPSDFTVFAGTIWFAASDLEHGRELWRTDGTAAGTRLAADIVPGPLSSDPLDIVATDDFLFFTAFDLDHGAEPWRVRRATPAAGEQQAPGPPPVTIAPIPYVPAATSPASTPRASISVTVKRLRTLRGRTRWRVSGRVLGTGCTGRVRVELGRGDRRLRAVTARLERCRFDARLATTSRTPGRWIAVRTVPTATLAAARSRLVRVR